MAKNYINDNNRWKSKGASMVEKAYGPSGFFDKVGDAISGVANTVGNVASTVGNALTGGGNDPQPPAGGGGGGGGLFPGLLGKLQAMRANAMSQMGMPGQGGDGQEVTVRGRIINDQFRPHFKGGFGANMNYTTSETRTSKKQLRQQARENKVPVQKQKLKKEYKDQTNAWLPSSAYKTKTKMVTQKRADRMTDRKSGNWKQMVYGDGPSINLKNLGGNLKDMVKGDPDVKKARIASREKNIALRQAEKTKRRAISAGERTERIKARNK